MNPKQRCAVGTASYTCLVSGVGLFVLLMMMAGWAYDERDKIDEYYYNRKQFHKVGCTVTNVTNRTGCVVVTVVNDSGNHTAMLHWTFPDMTTCTTTGPVASLGAYGWNNTGTPLSCFANDAYSHVFANEGSPPVQKKVWMAVVGIMGSGFAIVCIVIALMGVGTACCHNSSKEKDEEDDVTLIEEDDVITNPTFTLE